MKASELIGPPLDWAVGTAEGREIDHDFTLAGIFMPGWFIQMGSNYWKPLETYSPRQDWSQAGPIIEREKITVLHFGTPGNVNPWEAQVDTNSTYIDQYPGDAMGGPTPLIAAMRCFVASKLGDEVEIPEDLT